jgi:predicted amidohydrolase YtcJ
MGSAYAQLAGGIVESGWVAGVSEAEFVADLDRLTAQGAAVSFGSLAGGYGPILGSHAYAMIGMSNGVVALYDPLGATGNLTTTEMLAAFQCYASWAKEMD